MSTHLRQEDLLAKNVLATKIHRYQSKLKRFSIFWFVTIPAK